MKMRKSINEVIKISTFIQDFVSLNLHVSEDEDTELGDFIPSEDNIENMIVDKSLKSCLIRLLNESHLTEKEKTIIVLRYGLNGHDPVPAELIGKKFNITKQRVMQIETIAFRKIRKSPFLKYVEVYIDENKVYLSRNKPKEEVKKVKKTVIEEVNESNKGNRELEKLINSLPEDVKAFYIESYLTIIEMLVISCKLDLIKLDIEELLSNTNMTKEDIKSIQKSAISKLKSNSGTLSTFFNKEIELLEKSEKKEKTLGINVICNILKCTKEEFFELFSKLDNKDKNLIMCYCGPNFDQNNFRTYPSEKLYRFNGVLIPQMERMLNAMRNLGCAELPKMMSKKIPR